jgi:hypothetical protein
MPFTAVWDVSSQSSQAPQQLPRANMRTDTVMLADDDWDEQQANSDP